MIAIDELKNSLDLIFATRRSVNVFFRDDDADDDLPNLRYLLDLFRERTVPINFAVIPGTLTRAGAELLLSRYREAPEIVELSQHGWMHCNHESKGRKCEFGPSRSYAQQLGDIQRGRDRLNTMFGTSWYNAFTPPWNRCTDDTLRALHELGFEVLSRDNSEVFPPAHCFREIPVTFDIFSWKNGAILKTEPEIATGLSAQLCSRTQIGILLHHKIMTPDAFRMVAAILDVFSRCAAIQFQTLRQLSQSQEAHITCNI